MQYYNLFFYLANMDKNNPKVVSDALIMSRLENDHFYWVKSAMGWTVGKWNSLDFCFNIVGSELDYHIADLDTIKTAAIHGNPDKK